MLSLTATETYQQQLTHCQVMVSRTKILGVAAGATVVYVSSGTVRAEEALALIVTLLCVMCVFLLRVHSIYQDWGVYIRNMGENGTINLYEPVRQDLSFPSQVEVQQLQDFAAALIVITAAIILSDCWWPLIFGRELSSVNDIAYVISLNLIVATLFLMPRYACREGVTLSGRRFMTLWALCFLPGALVGNLPSIWIDGYPYYLGFFLAQLIQIALLIVVLKRRKSGTSASVIQPE